MKRSLSFAASLTPWLRRAVLGGGPSRILLKLGGRVYANFPRTLARHFSEATHRFCVKALRLLGFVLVGLALGIAGMCLMSDLGLNG